MLRFSADHSTNLFLFVLTEVCHGVSALHEALRDEVQRLKVATGQNLNMSGQHVFQTQKLQQSTLNNQQQQASQPQMHSDYMQRSGYGLSTGFMKAEGSSIAINHGSTASFG